MPHREVLVPGVEVRDLVEQGDHGLPDQTFTVCAVALPGGFVRFALELPQHVHGLFRPAGELFAHARRIAQPVVRESRA